MTLEEAKIEEDKATHVTVNTNYGYKDHGVAKIEEDKATNADARPRQYNWELTSGTRFRDFIM